MGVSHTLDLSNPARQNWTETYHALTVERVLVLANPGSGGVVNIYDYNHSSGNIPAVNEVWRVIRVNIPAAATRGAPFDVPIGARFQRGLTVRCSAAELNCQIVWAD